MRGVRLSSSGPPLLYGLANLDLPLDPLWEFPRDRYTAHGADWSSATLSAKSVASDSSLTQYVPCLRQQTSIAQRWRSCTCATCQLRMLVNTPAWLAILLVSPTSQPGSLCCQVSTFRPWRGCRGSLWFVMGYDLLGGLSPWAVGSGLGVQYLFTYSIGGVYLSLMNARQMLYF